MLQISLSYAYSHDIKPEKKPTASITSSYTNAYSIIRNFMKKKNLDLLDMSNGLY